MSTRKREVQLKADFCSTISENRNDQGGINISPATTEKTSPKDPEPEPQVRTETQETQVTTETQETQVTTELSTLHNHFLLNIFQMEHHMCKCKVHWTNVTEVWPNAFIGNKETAMDRAKLKEMGITYIRNTAAYKEYLQGKIDTKAEYYKEINITYYGALEMDEHRINNSKDLFPASEFIHKALSNTENKLLVHCIDGVSRSTTFFSGIPDDPP
ncbi:hypothetical protein G5714_004725 [Onychostoma macrolepis]|uniref:Dual specificity protein phosphatase n=1 Tax=Onychostoma macrolepis TaxID=369639 RepID=A0A7J6D5L7_9TELE|nr:hypothetical protein G5714_004725 [Onychostoma macrolepis]